MGDSKYAAAKRIFLEVCDLSASERETVLERECRDDEALRGEVQSLLENYDVGGSGTGPTYDPRGGDGDDGPRRRRIGAYRIVREIGRGGMGVVYLGTREDEQFKRHVAIKVLKRGMDTEEVLRRFEQERQVLAALNHPAIARLYEGGETDEGMPYFVMEYVEGLDIEAYCDLHRLHIDERIDLFRKICGAVHYAHQNLVVHRDLKPSNILVTKEGHPKLLDFGIAKLIHPDFSLIAADPTAPELRVMTPEYASPEQVLGTPITTASDVYSLGVLLYELVTGHAPYRIASRAQKEIERVICEVDPERPSTAISRVEENDEPDGSTTTISPETVCRSRETKLERLRRRLSGDIDNIVLMAMRKEPLRRYASAEMLAEDLRRHLQGRPVSARADTLPYRVSKFVARNRLGVAAAAVIVLLLLGGIVGTARGMRRAQVAEERAVDAAAAARIAEGEARAAEAAAHDERAAAEDARGAADRRLSAMIELAETLMVDIHDEIQQLDGALSARELLAQTAQAFLVKLENEAEDRPDLLLDLAFANDRIGDILGGIRNPNLGDREGALEYYERAFEIRLLLDEEKPEDEQVKGGLASSYENFGDVHWRTGNVEGALKDYQNQRDLRQWLLDRAPSDPERIRALNVVLLNVGKALVAIGEEGQAREIYERSLDLRRRQLANDPEDPDLRRDLSSALLRIGGRLSNWGQYEAALDKYQEALAVRDRMLAEDPENGRRRRDVGMAEYFVGLTLIEMGRGNEASLHAARALHILTQQAVDNPRNARATLRLGVAHDLAGQVDLQGGNPAKALEQFNAFRDLMETLVSEHPDDTTYRRSLAKSRENLARAVAETGDLPGAVEHARAARVIARRLAESNEDDVRMQEELARILALLGSLLADQGPSLEALRDLESSREIYEALLSDQPDARPLRFACVEVLARLAEVSMGLGDREEAERRGREALALLGGETGSEADELRAAIEANVARWLQD